MKSVVMTLKEGLESMKDMEGGVYQARDVNPKPDFSKINKPGVYIDKEGKPRLYLHD